MVIFHSYVKLPEGTGFEIPISEGFIIFQTDMAMIILHTEVTEARNYQLPSPWCEMTSPRNPGLVFNFFILALFEQTLDTLG